MEIAVLDVKDKAGAHKLEQVHNLPNNNLIVLYYRDGCPPCDALAPLWKKACNKIRRRYKCGDKNAHASTVIANVDDNGIKHLKNVFHDIKGTPTLMHMTNKNGSKTRNEFNMERTADNLTNWLRSSLNDVITKVNEVGNNNNNNNYNNQNNNHKDKHKHQSQKQHYGGRRTRRKTNTNINNEKGMKRRGGHRRTRKN